MPMQVYMFPGQGSQQRGMGAGLFGQFADLTRIADEILGYSIETLCLDDPDGNLNRTQYTQPAIYVVNALSYFKKLEETGTRPDFVLGHSLGEFNALLAAECFDFATGLKLVKKRGELMGQADGGGMAAVLGANETQVRELLKTKRLDHIDLANFNTPSQIVISGPRDDIMNAADDFEQSNIRYVPLNTSGAFHSRLMRGSMEKFEQYLQNFRFSALKIPVIANTTARPYQDETLFTCLAQQIASPVRWTESIQYLMSLGTVEFTELGHGEVVSGLVKKIKAETTAAELQAIQLQRSAYGVKNTAESTGWSMHDRTRAAAEQVAQWNSQFQVGQKVRSSILNTEVTTRTDAVLLFQHRAAIYLKGYNGYFELDELTPV
ncbi:Polyketide biosynthesis malonyl CoA-acyl carrier protein transacylase PksC [Dickeya dianthicola]|uniref:ACP S-malonyltransferase n=1 Tax=Dickeya dianthicola TaxID=204039 RepID=UPI0003A7664B|nr:ACP S-malonyltransferase [Dickeya dianthicola]AYC19643.1 Polyketide biosynthesis malonyl CoA-acyl carrier protein transacylase PksC [Dickeya dianthicola]MBI0439986.1 ACP S-malonyltransferase [Dickeya dianthicola]MBI0450812.1 ACP S-malonyltransferase [Dickeya dianthicola]MBI0452114.1 ACP S-malonyltransferase [Dickeya dianthicola]MBI0459595.1 ACP S-malonyltransferase [Dickeya dianthicola]